MRAKVGAAQERGARVRVAMREGRLQWGLKRHGLPLLCYTLLAVLSTWPLATQLGVAVPGAGYDSWQNIWNMWWLKRALLELRNPFFTDALYYPSGTSLYLHTLNPINFLLSLPVHALFGLIVAYNFVLLASLVASGYAAYLLATDVTGDRRAALLAGAIYASSGYLLAQVYGGHTHMVAAQFLPLAALALRRAGQQPTRWRVLLARVLLAINLLCDWQYFLFIMLWASYYTLAVALGKRSWRAALPLVAAIALACGLVLPLLIPTARLALATPTAATEGGAAFRTDHSVDLAGLLIPSQLHPLWGEQATQAQWFKAHMEIQNKTAHLGAVALSLALLALRRAGGVFWLGGAALFALLAMGPRLQLFGYVTDLPLPAALLYELPFTKISRYPVRFVSVAMLSLSVAAAIGAHALLATLARRVRRPQKAAQPTTATLTIQLASPTPGILTPEMAGQALTPLQLRAGGQELRLPLHLPAGETHLWLTLPDAGEVVVQRVDLQ